LFMLGKYLLEVRLLTLLAFMSSRERMAEIVDLVLFETAGMRMPLLHLKLIYSYKPNILFVVIFIVKIFVQTVLLPLYFN